MLRDLGNGSASRKIKADERYKWISGSQSMATRSEPTYRARVGHYRAGRHRGRIAAGQRRGAAARGVEVPPNGPDRESEGEPGIR